MFKIMSIKYLSIEFFKKMFFKTLRRWQRINGCTGSYLKTVIDFVDNRHDVTYHL